MTKVQLIGQSTSAGRGVGYYHQFLDTALTSTGQVEIVNDQPDLIHYTFFDLFYPTLPWLKQHPTVVTIHDLTPLVLSSLYPKGVKGSLNLIRQRLSLINVRAVVTDSQNSKSDLHHLFKLPLDKVFVTPLAVDPLYFCQPSSADLIRVKHYYHLPAEFVLTVAGGPNPNKNLPALAAATAALHLPLVIVGQGFNPGSSASGTHPELRDLIALQSYRHLVLPGFVPTTDLVCLYHLATVYCQSSLYEGFGLPLLEAMTAGCLVVSSNAGSLPEIYPKKALTFDPRRTGALPAALEKALNLADRHRQPYIRAAQQKAADFNWAKTARLTLTAYQHALSP